VASSLCVRVFDRCAWLSLVCLAAAVGLGDIAPINVYMAALLDGIHALLPLVILLAVAGTILRAVFAKQPRPRRWPHFRKALVLPSGTWLAVLGVSALSAAEFQSQALTALVQPASGLLLAWAVANICRSYHRWRRLVLALALGGLGVAFVALAEATRIQPIHAWITTAHNGEIPIGDVPRVAATLSHPNEAAMLLELTLPLLVACAWTASPRWRWVVSMAVLGTLLAIALTFSRAGIAATGAALGVLGLLAIRRGARTHLPVLGVAVLALPLALGWAAFMDPGLDHRFLAGLDESGHEQPSRVEFWITAFAMLRYHPLLGVGPDNFRWLFTAYSGVVANNLGIHAHNQYLESLADTGVLGLASFGWLIVAVTLAAARGVRGAVSDWPWRAALLASLTAWLVHAVLDDFEHFWPTNVAFWLIVGLIACRPLAFRQADQRLNSQ
jgi:O-antigen ligase